MPDMCQTRRVPDPERPDVIPDRTTWIDRCCKALDQLHADDMATEQLAALAVMLENFNALHQATAAPVLRLV